MLASGCTIFVGPFGRSEMSKTSFFFPGLRMRKLSRSISQTTRYWYGRAFWESEFYQLFFCIWKYSEWQKPYSVVECSDQNYTQLETEKITPIHRGTKGLQVSYYVPSVSHEHEMGNQVLHKITDKYLTQQHTKSLRLFNIRQDFKRFMSLMFGAAISHAVLCQKMLQHSKQIKTYS